MNAPVSALLDLRRVSRSFGGIEAVRDLSMQVGPDEILGLIGPNGAGKSTVVNLIAGADQVSAGNVLFRHQDVTALPEWRRVRAGLARISQNVTNLENASVEDNVALGLTAAGEGARRGTCRELLARVGLSERARTAAAALCHWERRRLALARALACEPALLLLDEPFAGLSAHETEQCMALLRELRAEGGRSFLLVEHNLRAVLRLCDRIVVMHLGEKIADGSPRQITGDRRVRDVYLGGDGPC